MMNNFRYLIYSQTQALVINIIPFEVIASFVRDEIEESFMNPFDMSRNLNIF